MQSDIMSGFVLLLQNYTFSVLVRALRWHVSVLEDFACANLRRELILFFFFLPDFYQVPALLYIYAQSFFLVISM